MSSPLPPALAATDRRGFFKRAGLGLGVAAAATTLQACDTNDDDDDAGAVTLDFSSDVGVLNYAYALEQLEAAFYSAVVADAGFGSTFNADEQAVLRALSAHENIHRDFFATAIQQAAGAAAVLPDLEVDFSAVNLSDRRSVLEAARTFEDTGVGAYNGAGRYLESADYLLIAGKIVSVEARHASVIAGLLETNAIGGTRIGGGSQIDGNGLDPAYTPSEVLGAVDPFVRTVIRAVNVPS
ncbi:ferritin-like domain-containing protein [Rubrivirga sp. S365]|uniref:Ferritin-like domain-containing protein n=1 Tax=Rubrivirga litoralis TaxID=3075598 RepID=A0ABU3BR10_9BACT|nr:MULTISPECIES: ferritin-like domain-containing protein [unclassified Rubrivirga]MDT0631700.1 ferritin-like domain-containing protein [Rubrivirga sp. F394]MDT7855556.1 ferritin-like domain-containing protein [Rubrivirga sp. S365]